MGHNYSFKNTAVVYTRGLPFIYLSIGISHSTILPPLLSPAHHLITYQ